MGDVIAVGEGWDAPEGTTDTPPPGTGGGGGDGPGEWAGEYTALAQSLDSYVFEFDPETIHPIPEAKNLIASVQTESDCAVFVFIGSVVGQEITLTWSLMPESMYQALRTMYLDIGKEFNWGIPGVYRRYRVSILDLSGKYIDAVFDQSPWRLDVVLKLHIKGTSY